jgi:arylsulfatase A-like enzyme
MIQASTNSDALVCSEDFFPTIMEMAGIQYGQNNIDGFSLLPVLKQTGQLERTTLYWHYPHYHHQGFKPGGAIREGDLKLIEWYEPTLLGEENQVNLYNLNEDIGETTDLAQQFPEKVTYLREKFHRWKKSIQAQEMKVNPNYNPQKADWRFETN